MAGPQATPTESSRMRPTLYLETTIPSYLTARPSRDPLLSGQSAATKHWWRLRRRDFDLFISQLVLDESRRGDAGAAARRMRILAGLPRWPVTPEVDRLAEAILQRHLLPPKAAIDAFHIATATVHGAHFLLTWNCAHINNREMLPQVERLCRDHGHEFPLVCTPLELMGVSTT